MEFLNATTLAPIVVVLIVIAFVLLYIAGRIDARKSKKS